MKLCMEAAMFGWFRRSPPVRGAWIETDGVKTASHRAWVASREGGVD